MRRSFSIAAPVSRKSNLLCAGAIGLVGLAIPFFVGDYRLLELSSVLVNAIALLGLILLTGFNGQVSLGHGGFFALGAYTAAILMNSFGLPYYLLPVPVALICFGFGFLFGRPALRLPGHLLALATFGFAMALPQVLRYKHLERWTGGVQGILLDKPEAPFGLPISPDLYVYLLVLAGLLVLHVVLSNLVESRMGQAIIAVRDNPVAASAMGIDVAWVKTVTFGLSASITGLAGTASALVVGFVAPDSFTVFLSLTLLIGAVIGGLTTPSGAILGALAIHYLPDFTEHWSRSAPTAIYGVALIAVVFLAPNGMAGLAASLWQPQRHRKARVSGPVAVGSLIKRAGDLPGAE